MANTKLILVEGLPGSGKSTTAQLTNDILSEMNINTQLFLEGNKDHPADYDAISYFTKEEFNHILDQFNDFKELLIKHTEEQANGYFLSSYRIRKGLGDLLLPEPLEKKLWDKDVYELPLDKHIELITEKWKSFCEKAVNSEDTYIFECCFIQNPVTIGMVKYGASDEIVMSFVNRLASIIEPLNPILIYVEQKDIQKSFKKAIQERSKEWFTSFLDYYNNQVYGKFHGVNGLEGTLTVLESRRQLESKIFDIIKMKKFKVDNSEFDFDSHKKNILHKLKL
ncbi:hypothetical protein [Bacillus sp. AFS055030]|uniref:hypothetical protein n=1 Tax=Bacillus sp. AFS055030 TaxID=2033507 RepID=UPI000BFC446D|nr:hypothetical protein [Bacillus sp. AFS055030]PGL70123.1 hypothetical protein CN925_13100 [Bacillus sp. AFS055030]